MTCFAELHKGQTVERWTILGRGDNLYGKPAWICSCICGNETLVGAANLKVGQVKSCGCYHREGGPRHQLTHGLSGHPIYNVWTHMMQRCYSTTHKFYSEYGGRGIRVCRDWHNVANFVRDMEKRYRSGLTLERVKNHLGYSPNNCVWATRVVQANNTRRNKKCRYEGKDYTLSQLSAKVGIPYPRLWARIKKGLSVRESVDMGFYQRR